MARKAVAIAGARFGRLTVVGRTGRSCECRCDCGAVHTAQARHLLSGATRSCGCLGAENRHGMRGTPEHNTWLRMNERCKNPRHVHYARYGGRGISVCERWKSFATFLADMGPRPSGTELDRIDNDGNYEPGNCRWATRKVNGQNRSNTTRLTVDGETATLAEWSARTGLDYTLLKSRVQDGWSDRRVVLTPKMSPRTSDAERRRIADLIESGAISLRGGQ